MDKLRDKVLWGYGFGNLGYGMTAQMQSSYLVFYATVILGMSGAAVGLLVSIGVFWDAFSDPIMGYVSDHTRSPRFGRRHQYILIGGIGVTLLHLFLWNIPIALSANVKWLIMICLVLGIKTFQTIYITPYTALAAELSDDYSERTRIQAVKTVFFLLGLFMAIGLGMAIFFRSTDAYPIGQLNPAGYSGIAIFGSITMILSMMACYRSTRELIPNLNKRILSNKAPKTSDFLLEVYGSFKNKDFRSVVLGYLFGNISAALVNTLALHVFTYSFAMNSSGIAIVAGTQLFSSVLSQPFWVKYTKSKEKLQGINLGILISIFSIFYFLICILFKDVVSQNFWWFIPFSVVSGFGTGGLYTLPQAMVADSVDANALITGQRQEGVFYGTLTLSYKMSQSFSIFVLGIALDLLKFDPNLPAQATITVYGLPLLMAIGGLISFVLAFIAYRPYSLTKARMKEIHKEI